MNRFVFLGAPGVGKGTFAKLIAPRLGVTWIGTGDLIRAEISAGTPLGLQCKEATDNGSLVNDNLITELVDKSLGRAMQAGGYLLEGFPRTVAQARHLDTLAFPPQRVMNIELAEWVATLKILGRRVCRKCDKSFNVCDIQQGAYDMPAMPPDFDACEHGIDCPHELFGRADDTKETVVKRMQIYKREVQPLLDYYTPKPIGGGMSVTRGGMGTHRLITFQVVKGIKDTDALLQQMIAP